MAYADINASLSPEDITVIKTGIDAIKAKLTFTVNLTPEERKALRKIGAHRVSYVSDLSRTANANQKALPGSFDLTAYNSKVKLMDELKDLYAQLNPVFEGLEGTLMAVGAEIMTLSDEIYGHLKVEAKKSKDLNLNAAVKGIGEQLKHHRKAAKKAES